MNTYVLQISRFFPAKHPRAGEPTLFVDKIRLSMLKNCMDKETIGILPKIHTIRANYDLWKKRIDEVNAGNAVLSIRYWSGRPYHSKQVVFATLDKNSGCGVQMVQFFESEEKMMSIVVDGIIKSVRDDNDFHSNLAKNDGLSLEDFKAWFKGYDLSKPMAIILFTGFRY